MIETGAEDSGARAACGRHVRCKGVPRTGRLATHRTAQITLRSRAALQTAKQPQFECRSVTCTCLEEKRYSISPRLRICFFQLSSFFTVECFAVCQRYSPPTGFLAEQLDAFLEESCESAVASASTVPDTAAASSSAGAASAADARSNS